MRERETESETERLSVVSLEFDGLWLKAVSLVKPILGWQLISNIGQDMCS